MLDSDVQNADSTLYVEFYEVKSGEYAGQPFIRIMNPGDKTSVFDNPVKEHHKERKGRRTPQTGLISRVSAHETPHKCILTSYFEFS